MTARTRERPAVRGSRRMPSMAAVAAGAGLPEGQCFRCRANARCERAHIIARCFDGLDGVQNLVPLCFQCHSDMPPFIPGEERKAWLWLRTTSETEYIGELVARALPFLPLTMIEIKVATSGEIREAIAGAMDAALMSPRRDEARATTPGHSHITVQPNANQVGHPMVPRRRPPEHDHGIAAYLLERRGAPGDAEQRRLDRRVRDWLAGVPTLTRPAWAR